VARGTFLKRINMNSLSLKWRLGISVTIMVITIIAVLSVTAFVQFSETLKKGIDNALLSQADAVIASMTSDDSLMEARREIQAFFGPINDSRSPVYRVWFNGEQEDYVASFTQENWPLDWSPHSKEAPAQGKYKFFEARREEIPYRLLWIRPWNSGTNSLTKQPLNIVIATYHGHIDTQIGEFLKVLAVLGIVIVILTIGVTVFILKWGLKPVVQITSKMDDVTVKNLNQLSHCVPDSPAEMQPFVQAWDRMIERLALAMQQQRRFTADASHELRTPLAIVKSTLQATRSRKRSSDAYELAIDQSLEDLGRLEHLIEQLLALAHLDDIDVQSDWRTINLGNLIADVCEQYLPFAQQEKGTIKCHILSAKVNGSDEQLRRLFANLIDNAIKYGPKSGEVSVSMHSINGLVNVLVHDQGGRIPRKEHKRIFDRFYRVRKSRKTSTGSGLGLAIAHEIAKIHRGSITLQSDPNAGTDFVVTLPLI
jgi:signal transduction histidine kinase